MKRRVKEQDYRKKSLIMPYINNFYNRRTGEWEYEIDNYGPGSYIMVDENGKKWVKKYYKNKGYQADKKHANRKIRHYKGHIKDGGHCFKIENALWNYY